MSGWRIGVDVGGTFTDLVLAHDDGRVITRKVLSSTADYAIAILQGLRECAAEAGIAVPTIGEVIHGTTVATNAILERRGARTGLITTRGFRDLLEIARLRLARLYDMDHSRPAPLVRRRWRVEVDERCGPQGEVIRPLDEATVGRAIETLLDEGVDTIAVCLLHAYANPDHERRIAASIRARAPQVFVSISSDVLPEIREFERTSTTVANAYVMPTMERYLGTLERELRALDMTAPLLVMQSSGGVMTARRARERPVQLIESGPAAGVIAAAGLARRSALPNVISLDMGGTTAKAAVIENYTLRRSSELEIGGDISQGSRLNKGGGYLLRTPAIDIAEVGAGGGSLVTVDSAGALHVGPQSAGANPGPVCYGLGGERATITDANVVLGYLAPDRLPSGLALDAPKGRAAVQAQVAAPMGLDLLEAAHGVYLVGCAGIARAVRAVTVERGRDPREFCVVAFGGNGPLYAAELARSLQIRTALIPPAPGVFSAVGLLEAAVEQHVVRTVNRTLDQMDGATLAAQFDALVAEARALLVAEGYRQPLDVIRQADLKYAGQSFELAVTLPGVGPDRLMAALEEGFGDEHQRTYGHRSPGDPVQLVNLRVIVTVPRAVRDAPVRAPAAPVAGARYRMAYFGPRSGTLSTPVLARSDLGLAPRSGPLLIDEYDATTLVPPGCTAALDAAGNIVIRTGD